MINFTIHIFRYGETQINSKELSVKTSTNTLVCVTPLIQAVFTKKPEDNTSIINNYHAINIFSHKEVRWTPKGKNIKGFSVEVDEELTLLIDALISELQVVKDNMPAE